MSERQKGTAPLVSVLIPAFRAEETILAAVDSVLAGGLPAEAVEILVESDDGRDYGAQLAHPSVRAAACGAVGSGPGAARNRALLRARGAYVTCLDADDVLAPGWLAALLPLAASEGAAASPLWIGERGEAPLLRLWQGQARLSLADLAETGASVRFLARRELFPPFPDLVAQDIMQALLVMARQGGSLPLSDRPYHLHLRPKSFTGAADFSARADAAYRAYVRQLEEDLPRTGVSLTLARAAADVFRAKIALNAAYVAEGAWRGYYRFIADRLAAAQGKAARHG